MTKLLWTPIDIPKVPDVSKLISSKKVISDYNHWYFARLTKKQASPYQASEWADWVYTACPELIEWFKFLPFTNIVNVKLNHQIEPVLAHIDFTNPTAAPDLWENNHINEPCGYRIIIKGSRSNALWVQDHDGSKIYCNMPYTTDTYVLDHTGGVHGVDDEEDRWTIFCHASIDKAAHALLLERSLETYKDYAIWQK